MAKDAERPYFQHGITQLEDLFEQASSDVRALRILDHELSFRATDRAARLRARVADALAKLSLRVVNAGETPAAPRADRPTSVIPFPKGRAAEQRQSQEAPVTASPSAPLPPVFDLGELPSVPVPKEPDTAAGILAAWTALEALSPQTYRRPEDLAGGDRRRVASLTDGSLPWERRERSRPKRRLYYQVALGAIAMDKATDRLVKAFGEDDERPSRAREKALLAVVLVDKDGVVLEEKGVAVSSFAWALPFALDLKLGALGAWPKVEQAILEKLTDIVRRVDDDGKPLPLDRDVIARAHRWLVAQFGLPGELVEPPDFALRVYHPYRAKNPPEASLLNSFFLGDLARSGVLVRSASAPAGLRRYLGLEKPKETHDLLNDRTTLERTVAPNMIPAARWPSVGGHPLVLLQQAAINLARAELANGDGIIAVNGPPGTGKTTLLRDVVAACVLDRAVAMAAFDDPESAFMPSGSKIAVGEKAFFHLYSLAPALKGHEVLVASSNNKAVENVSRELPAVKAVGRNTDELSYFRAVSDLVHAPRAEPDEDGDDEDAAQEPLATWGLIAAVLGNAKNRAAFTQTFWWDDDRSFRLYLKAAKGDPVVREIKDPETGKIVERRTPSVVMSERPPSRKEAQANWRKARARLIALKREVDAGLSALEAIRQSCLQLAQAKRAVAKGEAELAQLTARQPQLDSETARCRKEHDAVVQEHGIRLAKIEQHRRDRPGLFARLFRTERWKAWAGANAPLVAAADETTRILRHAEKALSAAKAAQDALVSQIRKAEVLLSAPRRRVAQLSSDIAAHRQVLGDRLVDEAFFARGHEPSNMAAPWIPDSLHRKREELFIAAMAVHRAFIDAAAQKVMHNLGALMDVFSGGAPKDEAKRRLLGDLWSTLFLVVPVISTTFASVDRMLGELPAGSIGWLLIDEAGQALPQAAVGAIMRAKRSIVVGDPLQIPPVVTLPERLNTEICRFFKVDQPLWAAPEASAQTVADLASAFQASFRTGTGLRRVGIPLLVHRRCQEPMFGIANRIAYDGQMVHATATGGEGRMRKLLGPSRWFDVDGDASTKWCPDEGEFVVRVLKKIAGADIRDPDLFIITPFRIVAQELRRRLERERELFTVLGVDARKWTADRVGTIHTVQGREAETVILVLGAPKATQHGARSWAAGTPNIVNVAVSRAKENLYVVGSFGAWSGVGHARELASALRSVRV